MITPSSFAIGIVLTAFMTVILAYWVARWLGIVTILKRDSLLRAAPASSVFLFKDRGLIDATPSARHLLHTASHGQRDWDRMLARLAPMFPKLQQAVEELEEKGRILLGSAA